MERILYPRIEPYATHRWDVGDGHRTYVEECGRRDGIPVVFLHGGPGGGLVPFMRQFFDPQRYRVVLPEQRGCGRSEPIGEVRANTTWHLIDDLERVRRELGIERWLLFGGSWGSTLALAYGRAHPERVTGMILRGVYLARRIERDFYQDGLRHFQPEEWARFAEPIPPGERGNLIAAYHRRLLGPPGPEADRCAAALMRWEAVNSTLVPDPGLIAAMDDLAAARILTHYLVNGGFLGSDDQLLDGVARLRHLPAVIVQGRYDLCCPPITAYELAERWPGADLRIVPAAGHSSLEPGIRTELIAATDRFADQLTGH